jgi:hypothetical protein
MKAEIKELRESFRVGYEAYEPSRKEANEAWDLYHNRHYTDEQLSILANRGQPAETFNVVKLFARMLVGYYSTIVNTVVISPTNPRDIDVASILNDTVENVFVENRFDIEGDTIKLGGMISGLLCAYTSVIDSGQRDSFGRPINKVVTHHVPDSELVLDPMSTMDDYSDARFLHRFKWLTKETVNKQFGKGASDKLDAYYNHLNIDEADFDFNYGSPFTGSYRVFDNYLVVHSVVEEEDGKSYSCFWSGEHMLQKREITFQKARWPYRVQRLHSSDRTEYYGIFREILESQRALNQAVLTIQLMVNSEKAFVEKGAVDNINDFTAAFNRVNAVIEVTKLSGVKLEKLSREIQEQYIIIDRALDRIQRVLGINDSFLGMAFASDSGRKVKLQQNATIMSLRYMTARIESFYVSLGHDIANLVQQYYQANQMLMLADEVVGARWIELHKPMMEFTGQYSPDGQPVMQPILLPMTNPADGEIMEDEEGNIILAPVSEEGSDFSFMDFQIRVESNSYNDEDEKSQLLLETVMSGQIGTMLSQVNPAGFFQTAALSIKSTKTKYSPDIASVLEQTAQMLSGNPEAQGEASMMAQGGSGGQSPKSKSLKLPQNTNEGVA